MTCYRPNWLFGIYVRYTCQWRINHWIRWISFFVTEFSARFVALLSESHFVSLNSVKFSSLTFMFLLFCTEFCDLFSTALINEKKKHFFRHHYIASFPSPILVSPINLHWFGWRSTSNIIAKFEENITMLGKKNLLVLQCNGFESKAPTVHVLLKLPLSFWSFKNVCGLCRALISTFLSNFDPSYQCVWGFGGGRGGNSAKIPTFLH